MIKHNRKSVDYTQNASIYKTLATHKRVRVEIGDTYRVTQNQFKIISIIVGAMQKGCKKVNRNVFGSYYLMMATVCDHYRPYGKIYIFVNTILNG